jgi:hypothetical protein
VPYGGYQGGYPNAQGGGGYGSNPDNVMSNEQRSNRLNQVAQQYEIHPQFAARLQALGNYEVVLLCDDSGSMNTVIQGTNQTRWDELKSVCFILIFIFNLIIIECRLSTSLWISLQ